MMKRLLGLPYLLDHEWRWRNLLDKTWVTRKKVILSQDNLLEQEDALAMEKLWDLKNELLEHWMMIAVVIIHLLNKGWT